MRKGDEVREFLLERLREDQPGKSSHWEEFLEQFSYSEAYGLRGLRGFGTLSRRGRLAALYHRVMQVPYKARMKNKVALRKFMASAGDIVARQDRLLDLDVLRQVFTVTFCQTMIPHFSESRVSVVIGDGDMTP